MTELQPTLFEGARREAFQRFHERHPEVYAELKRRALAKRQALLKEGKEHVKGRIRRIWEDMRDEHRLNGDSGEQWKLNNNHTRFYSRLLMEREPELVGFFEVRG
jgi:hypothetical protein